MENVPRTSGSDFQGWYCGSPDVVVLAILSVSPLKVNCSHATPVQCRWAFLSARWFQGYSQAESVFFLESSSVMRKAKMQVCRPSIAVIPIHHTLAAKVVVALIPQG